MGVFFSSFFGSGVGVFFGGGGFGVVFGFFVLGFFWCIYLFIFSI